ncbi:MAG: DUF4012 domain-containing protein [Patescibacteria group bacterium]
MKPKNHKTKKFSKRIAPTSAHVKVEKKHVTESTDQSPITIGLLQHEIDSIMEHHSVSRPEKELESTIMRELAKMMPAGETLAKKDVHHHTEIIVKNSSEHHHHSPFVLDLTGLVKKKKAIEEHKARIHSFFKKSSQNTYGQNTVLSVPATKNIIIKESAAPIEPAAPDEFPDSDELFKQLTPVPIFYHFNLPINWHRSVVSFIVVALLIIAPIKVFGHYQKIQKSKDQIVNYATTAYADMKIAGQELSQDNATDAEAKFNLASSALSQAAAELNSIDPLLKTILKILPTDSANLADAEYLLEAGRAAAQIGGSVSELMSDFKKNNKTKLTDRLAQIEAKLFTLTPKLNQLNNSLSKIRPEAIPTEKINDFVRIKKYLLTLHSDLDDLNELSQTIQQVLGSDYKKRYLFIFQNNNEIRPTGGFMGSYALVDIDRGEIKNMEIPGGGTYDLQGSLLKKVISPEPLHLINPLWEMQDANWFPNFPTSAQKIKWFYENSGGPSVDGVIAINATLIPELMKIIGNISLADGRTFEAAGFITELQKTIDHENKTIKDNQPKKILSAIAPELLKKIFASKGDQLLKISQVFKNGLDQKDIQLYFSDDVIQEKFSAYGWSGELLDSSKDYLSVINTNIGGNKTDYYIEQNIKLESTIDDDGDVFNTLTITRKHNGQPTDQSGQGSNLVYTRIYTPLASQLISAEGFSEMPAELFEKPNSAWSKDELLDNIQGKIKTDVTNQTKINNEFNKTVFANWIQTDAGEESKVVLKYKLPFQLNLPGKKTLLSFADAPETSFYSLFLQKQSGSQQTNFNIKINLPEGVSANWLYPIKSTDVASPIETASSFYTDQLFALSLK